MCRPDRRSAGWFYRQRIEAVLTRQQRPWFLVVDSGAFPAFSEGGPAPAIEAVAVEVTPALTRTAVVGTQAPKAEQQTIRPDAKTLFVAGAGWTKKQKDGAVHMQDAARLILGFVNGAQASLGVEQVAGGSVAARARRCCPSCRI